MASALPLMWAPPVVLMEPSGFTAAAWQALQLRASAPVARGGWPVGGIPWHDVQVSGVRSFQFTAAFAPLTPLKLKFPWHATLLQVFVTRSNDAPAAWTAGFCEKSTANPLGAWQSEQARPAEKVPPWRCGRWIAPVGPSRGEVLSVRK